MAARMRATLSPMEARMTLASAPNLSSMPSPCCNSWYFEPICPCFGLASKAAPRSASVFQARTAGSQSVLSSTPTAAGDGVGCHGKTEKHRGGTTQMLNHKCLLLLTPRSVRHSPSSEKIGLSVGWLLMGLFASCMGLCRPDTRPRGHSDPPPATIHQRQCRQARVR